MAQLLTRPAPWAPAASNASCPACGGTERESFLQLDAVPVFNNVLYTDHSAARAAPTAQIDLVVCHHCGLIANAQFDERLVEYSPAYENSLHGSGVFGVWAEGLAARLAGDHDLAGGRVLEVGAGSGEFLALLCEAAGCDGVGFDPSHDPDEQRAGGERVETGLGWGEETADLVVCRHVLEHVADPVALLRSIADRTRPRQPGSRVPIYLEVPDAAYMVTRDAFWDVIYEHPLYFDQSALRSTFDEAGFEVTRTGRTFGDQFAWIEGFTTGGVTDLDGAPGIRSSEELEALVTACRGFGRRFNAAIERQAELLDQHRDAGPIVIWGAGSKGVTYCNLVPHAMQAQVVDVSEKKAGKRLPVTGQSVLPPQALIGLDASLVVIMNGNYEGEIRGSLERLGVDAEIVVAR
ncbi:class I SAM-dependent methyltransferase [Euzebya tangerina]|uniref:class I SAM-dependent methyltransferase n=1 Tax=Euzebya tangerina TaxID=591198 RepID=UPI000E324EDA|nr:methyltransferase domain-containing protein [Euzebya tangerina]